MEVQQDQCTRARDMNRYSLLRLWRSCAFPISAESCISHSKSPPFLFSSKTLSTRRGVQKIEVLKVARQNDRLQFSLPKPGKPAGPVKHIRTRVFLPLLRKLLSLIILERVRHPVDALLSPSHSSFCSGLSCADVVWAHPWL